jgi:hypothetical protein
LHLCAFGVSALKSDHGRRQLPLLACPTIRGRAGLCDSPAESAQEINGQAYQQNQAKPAAADDGTAKVKAAAAEQEKQNNHE